MKQKKGHMLYRLCVTPAEGDGEGEDQDEWFSSLRAAKRRRRQLIERRDDGADWLVDEDLAIDRVQFVPLPPKQLLLRALNRCGFMRCYQQVVAPHPCPPRGYSCPWCEEMVFEGHECPEKD